MLVGSTVERALRHIIKQQQIQLQILTNQATRPHQPVKFSALPSQLILGSIVISVLLIHKVGIRRKSDQLRISYCARDQDKATTGMCAVLCKLKEVVPSSMSEHMA